MKSLLLASVLGLFLGGAPSVVAAGQVDECGGDIEPATAREAVKRFLTSSRRADIRDVVGLGAVSFDQVDRLESESDAEACERLRTWLPTRFDVADDHADWRATYYRVPGRYLVVLVPRGGDVASPARAARLAVFSRDGRMLALLD